MCGRTLAAVVAVFDELLRVVPRAAAARHRECEEEAGDDRADERAAHHLRTAEIRQHVGQCDDDDRYADGNQRRQNHFLQCSGRHDVDRRPVVGLLRAVHDAGHFPELTPHFFDDFSAGAPDRFHRKRCEQVRAQTADEQPRQHVRIADVEERVELVGIRCVAQRRGCEMTLIGEFLQERCKQHHGRETCGADSIAFGDGFGRVAHGVERIGYRAYGFRHLRHLGDAARIVGDRPERIDRDDDPGHREHRHHGDADAVEARKAVGNEDADHDRQCRQRRRLHRDGEPRDDVRCVPRDRSLRDVANRRELRARIDFGDVGDQAGHGKAHERADEDADTGDVEPARSGGTAAEFQLRHEIEADRRDESGDDETRVERVHDRALRVLPHAHEQRADDRSDDRDRTEHERKGGGGFERLAEDEVPEQHRGDRRNDVGLEEVGRHARAIADVVADVVRDDGGVTRIVLRDAGFHFADEVGAHVRRLGEDAAA